jgi:hypothetical protein
MKYCLKVNKYKLANGAKSLSSLSDNNNGYRSAGLEIYATAKQAL